MSTNATERPASSFPAIDLERKQIEDLQHRQPGKTKEDEPMSITHATDAYTVLPDDETVVATVVALEEHGFSVEVVPDLDAAREAVLARIPEGSVVMTNTSVTLRETGIAPAIDDR